MRFASFAVLIALSLPAAAQEAERGRLLYQTHCGGCHYERVHQRLRTAVKDLSDLRDMVARWAPETKGNLTLEDRENIVQYLNESHYRFGLGARRQRR